LAVWVVGNEDVVLAVWAVGNEDVPVDASVVNCDEVEEKSVVELFNMTVVVLG
jgi:hypothetical protein